MALKLKPLSDQTIVITGASSGIGLATARRAAREGARVVLAARNSDALREAVEQIEREGGQAAFVDVDVAEDGAAEKIAAFAKERFGGFDSWINNAATALYAKLSDTSLDEHRRIFDVGYFGLVSGSLVAAQALRGRGGAIINVGSVLSDRSIPIQGAYSAMKHAVKGFTETLRMELEMEDAGISVTLIKPGAMNTMYPEHARNKQDDPATLPPVIYDPRLVAKAICFAAANPKRSIVVGGGGIPLTSANIAPRLADRVMELFMGKEAQTIDGPPPAPGTADNLFEERRDGRIESNQDVYVRRSSLSLAAQMHPARTAALVGGAAAAAAAAYLGMRRNRGKRASNADASPVMQQALTASELSRRGREQAHRAPVAKAANEPTAPAVKVEPVG